MGGSQNINLTDARSKEEKTTVYTRERTIMQEEASQKLKPRQMSESEIPKPPNYPYILD